MRSTVILHSRALVLFLVAVACILLASDPAFAQNSSGSNSASATSNSASASGSGSSSGSASRTSSGSASGSSGSNSASGTASASGNSTVSASSTSTTPTTFPVASVPSSLAGTAAAPVPAASGKSNNYGPDDSYISAAFALFPGFAALTAVGAGLGGAVWLLA